MRGFLTLLLCIICVSGLVSAASNIDCEVQSGCAADEEEVVRLSNQDNAHASDSGFSEALCCQPPSTTSLDRYIDPSPVPGDAQFLFSLENTENSHLLPGMGGSDDYFLEADDGRLNCTSSSSGCPGGFDCLLKIDTQGPSFGHAQDCSHNDFDTSICCELLYDINSSGTVREETTYGGVQLSDGATVDVRYKSNNSLIVSTKTINGNFDLSGQIPYNAGDIMVYVKKAGYLSQAIGPYNTTTDREINIDTVLQLGSPCQADCTRRGDDFCDKACDGINGCSFSSATGGVLNGQPATAKDVCHLQKTGWLKDFNSTHNIVCCDQSPFPKAGNTQTFNVSTEQNVSNVVSYDLKTIIRKGKMVTLHVSLWD